jgi:hypothetical protein
VAVRIGLAMLGVVLVASPDVFGATLTTSAAGCTGSGFVIGPTSVSPTTIAPGSTGTIRTQICSGSAASHVLIDLEIYSQSGTKLAQRFFPGQSFSPGETKSYEWAFTAARAIFLEDGTYRVKIGVFSGDWSVLHLWDNEATTFSVSLCAPGADFTFETVRWGGLVIQGGPRSRGSFFGSTFIVFRVCSESAADVLVDVEIHDSAGVKVAQFVNPQIGVPPDFAAGETKFYEVFGPFGVLLPTGVYTWKVGVFSPDWSTLLHWENLATFTVAAVTPCAGDVTIGPTIAGPTVGPPGAPNVFVTTWVCVGATFPPPQGITIIPEDGLLIDLEIYDSNGVKVRQDFAPFLGAGVAGGGVVAIHSESFSLPPGTYTVKVGVFSRDWSTLYRWENRATTFTVP